MPETQPQTNNALFAPPSLEELRQSALFAPPTKEELHEGSPSNTHGYLERVQQTYSPGGQPAIVAEQDPEGNKRNAIMGGTLAAGAITGPLTAGIEGLSGVGARAATNAAISGGSQYASNKAQGKEGSENVGKALAIGAGGSVLADAVGSLLGYAGKKLSRFSKPEAAAYAEDPDAVNAMVKQLEDPSKMPELQNKAVEAINNSRKALKAQGLGNASKLSSALSDKAIELNPKEYLGIDPRVDSMLDQYATKVPAQPGESILGDDNVMRQVGGTPERVEYPPSVKVPANDANQMKRYLQENAKYAQGTVTDPIQAAKVQNIGAKASQLRSSIEGVEPTASDLNQKIQQSVLLQEAMRKGVKNAPIAFVTSESPDRVANLARAESAGQGGMLDFGNQLGAAKVIRAEDTGSGIPAFIPKAMGRGLIRSVPAVESTAQQADPLLSLIASDSDLRSKLRKPNGQDESAIARRMLSGQ